MQEGTNHVYLEAILQALECHSVILTVMQPFLRRHSSAAYVTHSLVRIEAIISKKSFLGTIPARIGVVWHGCDTANACLLSGMKVQGTKGSLVFLFSVFITSSLTHSSSGSQA